MNLKIDPSRGEAEYRTGIYVRAQHADGRWEAADIARLDEPSLSLWLRSRGGENLWAENVVRIVFGHEARQDTEAP